MQLRMFYILIFSLKQIDAIFHSVDNQFESIESIEVTATLPPPSLPRLFRWLDYDTLSLSKQYLDVCSLIAPFFYLLFNIQHILHISSQLSK